jgi:protein disulfide-isomerase
VAVTALALALGVFAVARAEDSAWSSDYKASLAKAKKEKRLVLADFTGSDWCGWCIKLKKEVFDTKEFQDWSAKNVVLLELDFPKKKQLDPAVKEQNDELLKKHGVRGFPTILFLDAEGKKVGELGYMEGGPKAWIAEAQKIITAAKG